MNVTTPASAVSEPEIASEPLRALRRGLTRAKGFALFVAVVQSQPQRTELIDLLQEAMPDRELRTVTLLPDSVDILDEILRQLGENISSPVMVTGLEAILSSDTQSHPILQSLNLRRPEWPQRISQPVVFWVSGYLLNLLSRYTPDFLDWRSDTIHFPEMSVSQLEALQSSTWEGGANMSMRADARRERVQELRSRITANERSQDEDVRAIVGGWLNELGIHLSLLGEMNEALASFQKLLFHAKEIGDGQGIATALGNIGNIYAHFGDASAAIGYYEQQLAIERGAGNKRAEGNALGGLGNVYAASGDTRRAIGFMEQRLALAQEAGDRRGEGHALGNLGVAHFMMGDAHGARGFYEQQLTIAREAHDRRSEATAIGNLGVVYRSLGDINEAIRCYEEQLNIGREIGDRLGESAALGNLGKAYLNTGASTKAISYYEQKLKIDRETGNRYGEATALWNTSLALSKSGKMSAAINVAEAALQIFESLSDPSVSKVRTTIEGWRKQVA